MSVSQSAALRAPHTVAVTPTEKTLDSLTRDELKTTSRVAVQVYNADATQTFNGIIYRKQTGMTGWAVFDSNSLAGVGPLTAAPVVDLDVSSTDLLEVRGTMSGLGGNVQIGIMRRAARP